MDHAPIERHNGARVFFARNDERGIELLRKGVAGLEENLGPAHRDTLQHTANLGSFLFASGQTEEGLELLESVLSPLRETFGVGHRLVVGFTVNAALGYTRLGIDRGSVALMERGEEIIRRALVPDEVAGWGRDGRFALRFHALRKNLLF